MKKLMKNLAVATAFVCLAFGVQAQTTDKQDKATTSPTETASAKTKKMTNTDGAAKSKQLGTTTAPSSDVAQPRAEMKQEASKGNKIESVTVSPEDGGGKERAKAYGKHKHAKKHVPRGKAYGWHRNQQRTATGTGKK